MKWYAHPNGDYPTLHLSCDVGGIGYEITNQGTFKLDDGRERHWEASATWASSSAGSPKQSTFLGSGIETKEAAMQACAADMRKRAADLMEMARDGSKRPGSVCPYSREGLHCAVFTDKNDRIAELTEPTQT